MGTAHPERHKQESHRDLPHLTTPRTSFPEYATGQPGSPMTPCDVSSPPVLSLSANNPRGGQEVPPYVLASLHVIFYHSRGQDVNEKTPVMRELGCTAGIRWRICGLPRWPRVNAAASSWCVNPHGRRSAQGLGRTWVKNHPRGRGCYTHSPALADRRDTVAQPPWRTGRNV